VGQKRSEAYLARKAAKRKAREEAQLQEFQKSAQLPKEYPRWFRVAKWIVGSLILASIGLVASVYQLFGGPPWPTEPTFVARASSFGSPLDIPFIVENHSVIFWIRHPQLKCRVISLHTLDNRLNVEGGPGVLMTVSDAPNADIKPSGTAAAVCAANHFKFPGTALRDGKIKFIVEYDSLLPWRGRIETESEVFTLNTALVPPQWIEGESMR
jgi:hypothetical protein